MKQVIIGGINSILSATATEYNPVVGGYVWTTTADNKKQVVSAPGTLSNLLVELSAAPGNGNGYTLTLMKNGTPTDLAVTISGTDTTGLDTDSVAVVAGDIIQLRCVPSGTPATPIARWSVLFKGTNANESLILGLSKGSATATRYCPVMHARNASWTAEGDMYQIIPTPGKIMNLFVALSESPGASPCAYRFTLRKNGESTALVVTITGPDTTGNNAVNEIVVAAGDYVNLMIEPLNTPSAEPVVWFGFTFVADTDGESLLLGQSSVSPSTAITRYNHLVSTGYNTAWDATEADMYQGGQPMTLKKLYVKLSGAPNGGKSYLIGARVNGTTRLSVTIADAATTGSDLVNTWDVVNFDDLNMISTPSGTPTAIDVYWGLVGYIEPPPPPTIKPSGSIAAKMVAAGLI